MSRIHSSIRRRSQVLFMPVLAFALLVSSCTTAAPAPPLAEQGKPTAPPGAKQESSKEAKPKAKEEPKPERAKISASHTTTSGTQSILAVTKDAGLFDKYGLDVSLVFISGGTKALQAMMAGDIAFTMTGGAPVVEADLAGADAVVILGILGTVDHVLIAKNDVKNPQGLKGKRLGINRFGSVDDYAARVALKKWGLDAEKDVALLQVGEQAARFAALEAGAVDATLIQPPLTAVARKKGYAEFPLSELGADYPTSMVVTTKSYVGKNEDVVRRFVKALAEGVHFYKTDKQATMNSIQTFMKLDDKEAIEEAYDKYSKLFPEVPYPTVKGMETVIEDTAATNPKAKGAKPEDFLDTRFVKELDDSGFIKKLYGR